MYAAECPPEIVEFAQRCRARVGEGMSERELTAAVSRDLTDVLSRGFDLPEGLRGPRADRYVMYPLHVSEDDDLSIASAVWDVAQTTPVHGHETWGVVGIHSGQESERRYVKPDRAGTPLTVAGEAVWSPGQVTVCCTTDDDVHTVWNDGDTPAWGSTSTAGTSVG